MEKFLVDAHCHLARKELQCRVDAIIREALENNVKIMIVSVQNEVELHNGLRLHEKYPLSIFLTLGQDLTDFTTDMVSRAEKLLCRLVSEGIVVGIGEIGLDYGRVRDPILRGIAKSIFERWLEVAKKLDLPVIVHSRRAHREVIELLRSHGLKRVVLHAFYGGTEAAKRAVDEGFFFSIPPSIVHSKQKQKLVKVVPLDQVLLESDSPELGPEYGAESRPVHVKLVAKKISEIVGTSEDDVIIQTTENALKVFKLRHYVYTSSS